MEIMIIKNYNKVCKVLILIIMEDTHGVTNENIQ